MIELWLMLGALLLPLAVCIAWPMLRRSRKPVANSEGGAADNAAESIARSTQAALFREHEAELEASRASGAISEKEFKTLRAEMARKLMVEEHASYRLSGVRGGGRGLLFVLAFAIPFCAVGLYLSWGAHGDVALYRDIVSSQSGATDSVAEASITQRLRERAESHPDDLSSRYVLAQRLLVSNDLSGAVKQYRYIVARQPQATHIRAELAQALFFASGSKMTDEVTDQVNQVLEGDPNNGTALGLAGIAAFEREEFRAARDYWRKALAQTTSGSGAAQALSAGVARAERAMAEAGMDDDADAPASAVVASSPQQPSSDAAGADSIRVQVSLSPAIDAAPDTPVFIYARGTDSPMPLAIVRLTAADLPAEVVLDESRAMMPGRSIETVDQVQVLARLAVKGNARPAPGDWQGDVVTLKRAEFAQPIAITIDTEL
ncbi:c-type cytochrome biogenesis protein CcmI [Microbulbifer celer]|uniref:C-type cytochrome biogenesis protein CcmI n=1 Tax=Microbulbifer celer TaxID=435905 RepID=A0ABW3UE94_9GAMM|nr:c-type cytochrome biogenesis protein CcmI [Microbulbifer celer]UFN59099.1 c-type cytochrome biogenesis protein CcmI [Microbulbifer celer]